MSKYELCVVHETPKRFFALNAPPTECLCCNHVCGQRSSSGEQACSGIPYPRISPHFPPVFPHFPPFSSIFPRFPPFPPFSPFFRGPKKTWRLRGGRLPRPDTRGGGGGSTGGLFRGENFVLQIGAKISPHFLRGGAKFSPCKILRQSPEYHPSATGCEVIAGPSFPSPALLLSKPGEETRLLMLMQMAAQVTAASPATAAAATPVAAVALVVAKVLASVGVNHVRTQKGPKSDAKLPPPHCQRDCRFQRDFFFLKPWVPTVCIVVGCCWIYYHDRAVTDYRKGLEGCECP